MAEKSNPEKFLFVPWDFEFVQTDGKRRKVANDGAVDIPQSEWDALNSAIRKAYASAINDILKELKDFKPEIDENAEKKALTKAFNKAGITALINSTVKKNGLVQKVVDAIMLNTSKDMLTVMHEQSTKLDLGFDEARETDAIARLTSRRMDYYKDIPDTLTDTVIQTLVDTIDHGDDYKTAVDKLKILREDFTTHRAETIVRTEIGRSRREAKLLFGETHADLLDKKWVATQSGGIAPRGRRRKSHQKMHGKTVGIHEMFVVDYTLDNKKYPSAVKERYPGDSKYGINCACELELIKKKGV